jgi:hypothetical protein
MQRVAGDLGLVGGHRPGARIAPQRQQRHQDAARERDQQDAQLARQRQMADDGQAQVLVETARCGRGGGGALLAAGQVAETLGGIVG